MDDIQKLLAAVKTGLSVVKQVAELPGVNVIPYATTLSTAIGAVQVAVEAGENIMPYVTAIKDTFSGDAVPPTEEQLAALDTKIAALRSQLHAPLPPKEDGEDD